MPNNETRLPIGESISADVREQFLPPESVTIPGAVALEALALLDAYAELMADFRIDGQCDPFFNLENTVWLTLMKALGHDHDEDLANEPVWHEMKGRSDDFQSELRSHLDGPALGAIAATKMARDIDDVKAFLEYARR